MGDKPHPRLVEAVRAIRDAANKAWYDQARAAALLDEKLGYSEALEIVECVAGNKNTALGHQARALLERIRKGE